MQPLLSSLLDWCMARWQATVDCSKIILAICTSMLLLASSKISLLASGESSAQKRTRSRRRCSCAQSTPHESVHYHCRCSASGNRTDEKHRAHCWHGILANRSECILWPAAATKAILCMFWMQIAWLCFACLHAMEYGTAMPRLLIMNAQIPSLTLSWCLPSTCPSPYDPACPQTI